MSARMLPVLLLSLYLTVGSVQSQGSSQDSFIVQYMERRLAQIEVGDCTSIWHQVPASLRRHQSTITSILAALTINCCLQCYSSTLNIQYILLLAFLAMLETPNLKMGRLMRLKMPLVLSLHHAQIIWLPDFYNVFLLCVSDWVNRSLENIYECVSQLCRDTVYCMSQWGDVL